MHELKAKDPNVFGPGGGSSRTFSMTETSFAIGLVLGPLLTGALADEVGFYYATCALGTYRQSYLSQQLTGTSSMCVGPGFDKLVDILHAQGAGAGAARRRRSVKFNMGTMFGCDTLFPDA